MLENHDLAKRILKRGYFSSLPLVNEELREHVILWRTVLDMALADLLRGQEFIDSMEDESWDQLLKWFNPENTDFQTVCYMSQLEPHIVYRKMDDILFFDYIPRRLK